MAVNKVVINTENGAETLIDLTSDTVTPETLAEGKTAHNAAGEIITGTMTERSSGDISIDGATKEIKIPSGYYADDIVANGEVIYDFGYDAGYKKGLDAGGDVLEALGALCDWSIMTDTSSIPTVCLVNYHPTYYMSCSMFGDKGETPFYLTEEGEAVYPEEGYVVVAPDSALDLTFDYPMSSIGSIYVENMRWSKDGAI